MPLPTFDPEPGQIIVATGWPAPSYLHRACIAADVKFMSFDAAQSTTPEILANTHPQIVTAIVANGAPESRFRELCELADLVLHVRGDTAVVVRENRSRARLKLEAA